MSKEGVTWDAAQREIGSIFQDFCRQSGVELVEGYVMKNHIHMSLMIPAKFRVAKVVGFLKRMSAIQIFRNYKHVRRNFAGYYSWARGYSVSTVGFNEKMNRDYIKNQ
ncbi:IS200/IS605 family transposase [Microbulbifer epialgicus]|uniref:IS200/IS605 family transposase n=1 Tax=Microbulbifer epialgicus TaxID=393907 RepID=A0ABV4NVX9_9GAMM